MKIVPLYRKEEGTCLMSHGKSDKPRPVIVVKGDINGELCMQHFFDLLPEKPEEK